MNAEKIPLLNHHFKKVRKSLVKYRKETYVFEFHYKVIPSINVISYCNSDNFTVRYDLDGCSCLDISFFLSENSVEVYLYDKNDRSVEDVKRIFTTAYNMFKLLKISGRIKNGC